MVSKIVLLLICKAFLVKTIELDETLCPNGCICEMWQNLRGVLCNDEKLTSIEAYLPNEVQYLDLSDNIISKIDDFSFKEQNLVKLVVLNMSANSLSQISLRAFDSLDLLQIIDLSNNVLHSLPVDVFEKNSKLLELYLSGNKFGFLESEPILNSNSIQVLDLSNCIISHLHPITFSNLPRLSKLDISHNFIIQLTSDIFENLPQLNSLKFSNNKLECNNKMDQLISYLTQKQIKFENVCQKVEKFQKLIIVEPTTEKSSLIKWDFIDCKVGTTNVTKCEVYKEDNMTIIWMGISFIVGLFVGTTVTCCCVHCICTTRRRSMLPRRRRRIRQPVDDLLLTDLSYNIGQSTPVLSRIRHSAIIK